MPDKKTEIAISWSNQYFAMTGDVLTGFEAIGDCHDTLTDIVAEHFGPKARTSSLSLVTTSTRSMTAADVAQLIELLEDSLKAEPSRSEGDFHLCCVAIERDWPKEEVWLHVKDSGKFKEGGRTYFDRTWTSAQERVASSDAPASQATRIVRGLLAAGATLFRAPNVDTAGFVQLPVGDHIETWPIASRSFKELLWKLYWDQHEQTPSAQAIGDALSTLSGHALHSGISHEVAVRIAGDEEGIWIDLCDDAWQAIHVTAEGWQVVQRPGVRFMRNRNMRPLPAPVRGGNLDMLREFINIESREDWLLLMGWLVSALKPWGPYSILNLNGEQGSAKTTAGMVQKKLIDPHRAPLRNEPRNDQDLMIAASNSWLLAFDNLSRMTSRLSDAMCRLSTGSGLSTRSLYTDDEEKVFEAQRPMLFNGIVELVTRPDLLDRTISITLPTIPEAERKLDRKLWQRFEQARPQILGALCDAVATALAEMEHVEKYVGHRPRMADFAIFAAAAAPAFGASSQEFLDAYQSNRDMVNRDAIESQPLVQAIIKMIQKRHSWEGTATELMRLPELLRQEAADEQEWPRQASQFAGLLKRIAPLIRSVGIGVRFLRRGKARTRIISIRETEESIVRSVRPVRVKTRRRTAPTIRVPIRRLKNADE